MSRHDDPHLVRAVRQHGTTRARACGYRSIKALGVRVTMGWAAVLLVLTLAAADGPAKADQRLVIPAGHESQVLALLAPQQLGDELAAGWQIENVKIDGGDISVDLLDRDQHHVTLLITHPSAAKADSRTVGGVALSIPAARPPAVDKAIDVLEASLIRNAAKAETLWAVPSGSEGGSGQAGDQPQRDTDLDDQPSSTVQLAVLLAGCAISAIVVAGWLRRRRQARTSSGPER